MNFFAFSVSIYLKTLLSYVLYYHCIKLFLPTRRRISLQSVPASLRFSVELSPTWMLWSTFIHFQSSRIGEFSRAYTFFKNSPLVQYYLSLCITLWITFFGRSISPELLFLFDCICTQNISTVYCIIVPFAFAIVVSEFGATRGRSNTRQILAKKVKTRGIDNGGMALRRRWRFYNLFELRRTMRVFAILCEQLHKKQWL